MSGNRKKELSGKSAHILWIGGTILGSAAGFGISQLLLRFFPSGVELNDLSASVTGLSGIITNIVIALWLTGRSEKTVP